MKMLKRITSIILVLAMVVTVVTINPTEANAKVTLKSKKSVTLVVKKTSKIKVKEKGAKYKTSNKKVATVSKSGKITAKAPGTCKITVTVKKSKKKVTVKVIPADVTVTSANNVSDKGIMLEWNGAKGAKGYTVYYSTNAKSGFKSINAGNVKRAYINNLNVGSTYYFKVKATAKVGTKTYTSAKYSNVVSEKVRKLVWNDEFKGTELDSTKWHNEGATGAGGYGNRELQNYQMNYCEVKDDNLIIKPQLEYNPKTKTILTNRIYSTKLWTKDKFSFTYGKVEFRVKMPKGKGTWAAGWMLGNQSNYGSWPMCGEIDVFETTSDPAKRFIPQSVHCRMFNGMEGNKPNKHWDSMITDATSVYHTYGLIWKNNCLVFTIDGKVTGTYDPKQYVAVGTGLDKPEIWPYNKPFYLILNCAVGGVLGGDVGLDYWTKVGTVTHDSGAVNDIYQDKMYIDYVRVYQ